MTDPPKSDPSRPDVIDVSDDVLHRCLPVFTVWDEVAGVEVDHDDPSRVPDHPEDPARHCTTVHCTHCTYLSGTFLSWSLRALALLWEKMTGAEEAMMASIMVWPDTWEMSTIMPSLFISWTTSRPNWRYD